MRSFAVIWRTGNGPVSAGKLVLGTVGFRLATGAPGGRRSAMLIRYADLASVEKATAVERLHGRPTSIVRRKERPPARDLRPGLAGLRPRARPAARRGAAGSGRCVSRLVLVVPLEQGAAARARSCFATARRSSFETTHLERHEVYLTDREAVFVFETAGEAPALGLPRLGTRGCERPQPAGARSWPAGPARPRRPSPGSARPARPAQGAQGVEDHGDVDALLQERADDRREVAERRRTPMRDEAQADAGEHALAGDARARGAPIADGVGDPVDPVDDDDGVGGLGGRRSPRPAPMAMPTSASASAGASLTPSPTMTTGRRSRRPASERTSVELVLGRLLGVDAVDADAARPIASATARAVAGHHRDVADARRAQPRRRARRASGRRWSASTTAAGEPAVDADEHVRAGAVPGVELGAAARRRRSRARAASAALADGDPVPVDRALDALAGAPRPRPRGSASASPRRCGGVHERLGERVGGELVDRGGEPQQLVRRHAVERTTRSISGLAERERAGLVEEHRPRLAELLDRGAALDDHARARRARDAGDERDRRREDQRARRRDDEHGERRAPGRRSAPRRAPATTSVTGRKKAA